MDKKIPSSEVFTRKSSLEILHVLADKKVHSSHKLYGELSQRLTRKSVLAGIRALKAYGAIASELEAENGMDIVAYKISERGLSFIKFIEEFDKLY